VKVILANLGQTPFEIVRGERIASLSPPPSCAPVSPKPPSWMQPAAAAAALVPLGGDLWSLPCCSAAMNIHAKDEISVGSMPGGALQSAAETAFSSNCFRSSRRVGT
jgi:hypothetical protein